MARFCLAALRNLCSRGARKSHSPLVRKHLFDHVGPDLFKLITEPVDQRCIAEQADGAGDAA